MNREDVIRMAREAGLSWDMWRGGYFVDKNKSGEQVLMQFAALVAAAEREACAKACDDGVLGFGEETPWAQGYVQGIRDVADGIRARSTQHT